MYSWYFKGIEHLVGCLYESVYAWYACGLNIWGFIHLDNCFNICFVSVIAFSLGWTKLGLIYLYLSMRLNTHNSLYLLIQ